MRQQGLRLNRFAAKLVQSSARLAFWRKPALARPEQPETPTREAGADLNSVEPKSSATADTPEPQVGRLSRLKQALRWRRKAEAGQPLSLDQTVAMAPPSRDRPDATADDVSMPKRSLLARIANRFSRQPGQQALDLDADEPTPGTGTDNGATGFHGTEAPDGVGGVRRSPLGRVLATLSNKWIWIPGVSVMVLALAGALLMLLQSAQEKEHLRAELLATQEKLEQTAAVKHVEARPAAPSQVEDASHAGAGRATKNPLTAVNVEDCLVTDQESVTRNLRNCIDSFNRSPAKAFRSGKSP